MSEDLLLSQRTRSLWRGRRRFDPWALAWTGQEQTPGDGVVVDALAAVSWLYKQTDARRVPVGVIGPRAATPAQLDVAEALGRALGEVGLPMLCGGRAGVMEAVCKGNLAAGGQPIGLLPEAEWTAANPYVAIPLATGIGEARNAVIARACFALIAVGGSLGTLTEVAYGRHFDRLVVALEDRPAVPGVVRCDTVADAIATVCAYRLRDG